MAAGFFGLVGASDSTPGIERVTVSQDGKLHVWDKYGKKVSGWPKDLSAENSFFAYRPRLIDTDFDLQSEIVAVSENKDNGDLRMHVYKGDYKIGGL